MTALGDRRTRETLDEPSCCSLGTQREALQPAVPVLDTPEPMPPPPRVVRLPGGRFRMGTQASPLPQDGESPTRLVNVKPFAVDPLAVTNDWFCEFVVATGYATEAERYGWSLVFAPFVPEGTNCTTSREGPSWWRRVEGASWKQPEGPQSSLAGRLDHPVVHISWNDATAFAAWAGGRLATEAEWEYAAAGGIAKARFPWGEKEPDDTTFQPCNIWQGEFPVHNTASRRSPRDGTRRRLQAQWLRPIQHGRQHLGMVCRCLPRALAVARGQAAQRESHELAQSAC